MFRNIVNKKETATKVHHSKIVKTMSENAAATTSAAVQKASLPLNITKVDLEDRKKKNDAWIRAFKKTHGVKKQTTLPSQTMQHNEWAIRSGWSQSDATTWRALCEKAKYAIDDTEGLGLVCLIGETIAMANHCDAHPIALINFARTSHGRPVWDLDTLDYLQAHLLDDQDVDAEATTEPAQTSSILCDDCIDDDDNDGFDLPDEIHPTQPMSPPAFPSIKEAQHKRRRRLIDGNLDGDHARD